MLSSLGEDDTNCPQSLVLIAFAISSHFLATTSQDFTSFLKFQTELCTVSLHAVVTCNKSLPDHLSAGWLSHNLPYNGTMDHDLYRVTFNLRLSNSTVCS